MSFVACGKAKDMEVVRTMAKATVKLPDELLSRLSRLGEKTDEIAAMALEAGGKVVLDQVRGNLEAVVGSGTKYPSRATGELVRSLGMSPVKVDRNGNSNVKIGFSEPHTGGKRNAMLASILENGKSGQPPKPFMKPAQAQSRKACQRVMKEVLEREVEKF